MKYKEYKKQKESSISYKMGVSLAGAAIGAILFGGAISNHISHERKIQQTEYPRNQQRTNYQRTNIQPLCQKIISKEYQPEMVYSIAGNNASLDEIDGHLEVIFPGQVQSYYKLPTGEQTRDISREVFGQKQNSLEEKARHD